MLSEFSKRDDENNDSGGDASIDSPEQLREEIRRTVRGEIASQRQRLQDFAREQRRIASLEMEARDALRRKKAGEDVDFRALHAEWGRLKLELKRAGLDADIGLDPELEAELDLKVK